MHNRVGGKVKSFELSRIEWIAIGPLVAIIVVLAFYPQFGLNKSEASVKAAIAPAATGGRSYPYNNGLGPVASAAQDCQVLRDGGVEPMTLGQLTLVAAIHHLKGPHIYWAALSPIVVLTVGALVVLLLGLLRSAVVRERFVPAAHDPDAGRCDRR